MLSESTTGSELMIGACIVCADKQGLAQKQVAPAVRLLLHVLLLPDPTAAERGVCSSPGQVHAVGEGVHVRPLHAHIIDADLGVGHTTAVPGLGVRLPLTLPVAACWTCGPKSTLSSCLCSPQSLLQAAATHGAPSWLTPGSTCLTGRKRIVQRRGLPVEQRGTQQLQKA
jgi:hypothetical protein